jgi:hypothetical protein
MYVTPLELVGPTCKCQCRPVSVSPAFWRAVGAASMTVLSMSDEELPQPHYFKIAVITL